MVFTFLWKVEDPRVDFVMASQVGPLLCVEGFEDHSIKIFGCAAKSAELIENAYLCSDATILLTSIDAVSGGHTYPVRPEPSTIRSNRA